MRGLLLVFLWLLAPTALGLEVRVLLVTAPELAVVLPGPHAVWGPDGPLFTREVAATYRLRFRDGRVWLEGRALGGRVSLVPRGGEGFALGGRSYPGFLRVFAGEDGLLAVNVVDLEAYLEGVLPGEMPASFPLEALKAQAVIARTYALERLGSHATYDLCASAACQVYLGRGRARPAQRTAVRATRGRILAFHGQPVRAVYHADSGGETASSYEVWGKVFPYLVPQPDPYTRARSWRYAPDRDRVRRALAKLGIDLGTVLAFEVLGRTESGRIGRLRVRGQRGSVVLGVPQVTGFLRAIGLPSTLARVEGGWTFVGRGSGHGVGLSQWGARGLAARGFDYRAILGHYYPGTVLAPYVLKASSQAP